MCCQQLGQTAISGLSISAIEAVTDFLQVVRRDFGRHADGDAVRAVDKQIRELGRAGPAVRGICRRSCR